MSLKRTANQKQKCQRVNPRRSKNKRRHFPKLNQKLRPKNRKSLKQYKKINLLKLNQKISQLNLNQKLKRNKSKNKYKRQRKK